MRVEPAEQPFERGTRVGFGRNGSRRVAPRQIVDVGAGKSAVAVADRTRRLAAQLQ